MENFTNETIDLSRLPRFEAVEFTLLHPKYWTVVMIHLFLAFGMLWVGLATIVYFNDAAWGNRLALFGAGVLVTILVFLFARMAFRKKGFAFRNHDVLFRTGVIATNTIVIPYNRVQHVALHEGLVSRYFGLAKIEIFTAGGSSSDIEIPGIKKEQAENIKQLLMGKIQKQL